MSLHYYISRDWIVSTRARRVYRTASMLSLLLLPLVVAESYLPETPILIAGFRLLFFACVVGAGTVLVAMEYFFFGFDRSPGFGKALWFLVLVLIPIGPPLYCFFVYSRSHFFKPEQPRQASASG